MNLGCVVAAIAMVLVLLALLACDTTPDCTKGFPVARDIAFVSERDGNDEIYLMNSDGSDQNRLTDGAEDVGILSLSGRRIAFASDKEIYVISPQPGYRPDLWLVERLTDNQVLDSHPRFSPDGQRITFVSQRDGIDEIYVMNADGSDQTPLTDNPGRDIRPVWSPNGGRIAFSSMHYNKNQELQDHEIYVMNADGSSQTRLTDDPGYDGFPTWSPDGRHIAFRSDRDGDHDIYVINADGSNERPLTDNPRDDFEPAWSPDGRRIVFQSGWLKVDGDIYVVSADGSGLTRLTDSPAEDWSPIWSPDGQCIAFHSDRDGEAEGFDIYVMNADGSALTQLTDAPGNDWMYVWPDLPVRYR